MKIISTKNVEHIARNFATKIGCDFLAYKKESFKCGEIKIDFSESIHEKNVILFTSTHQFQEYFTETLLLLGQIRGFKPKSIKLIICYFGYGRQEKIAQFICKIFTRVCDKVILIDPHFQTKNCICITHKDIFEEHILDIKNPLLILPDKGSIIRNKNYKIDKIILQKYRQSKTINYVSVANKNCIIIDDIIDSGETIRNAMFLLQNYASVEIVVTHILSHFDSNIKVTSTNSIGKKHYNTVYIEDVLIKHQNLILLAN